MSPLPPFKTPILLIAFNRIYTLEQVFPEIKAVKPPRLYFAVDGPRENKPGEKELVDKVKQFVLSRIDWQCDVKILFGQKNFGTKYAIANAIKWFFSQEQQGIVLEDDCLPCIDFFYFCQVLLEKYKNDTRIGMISGFNRFDNYPCNASYHFSTGGPIWGYASWSRVGANFDVDSPLFQSPKLKEYLLAATSDPREVDHFIYSIKGVIDGKVKSWDYSWGLLQKINSQIAIISAKNLIRNIGLGKDATHYDRKNYILANIPIRSISFPLIHPECISADRTFSKMLAKPLYPSIMIYFYHNFKLLQQIYKYFKSIFNKNITAVRLKA